MLLGDAPRKFEHFRSLKNRKIIFLKNLKFSLLTPSRQSGRAAWLAMVEQADFIILIVLPSNCYSPNSFAVTPLRRSSVKCANFNKVALWCLNEAHELHAVSHAAWKFISKITSHSTAFLWIAEWTVRLLVRSLVALVSRFTETGCESQLANLY